MLQSEMTNALPENVRKRLRFTLILQSELQFNSGGMFHKTLALMSVKRIPAESSRQSGFELFIKHLLCRKQRLIVAWMNKEEL